MASRLAPPAPSGVYKPEQYNRTGANYQKYGEQPGFYYDSYTDTYHVDPNQRKKELQGIGVLPPDEEPLKPRGLGSILLPVAGAAGAIAIGKALGPKIVSMISNQFGPEVAAKVAPEITQQVATQIAAQQAATQGSAAGLTALSESGGIGIGGGGGGGELLAAAAPSAVEAAIPGTAALLPEASAIPGVSSGFGSLLGGPTIEASQALAPQAASATPGLGMAGLAGPAAFLAAAPMYAPILMKGMDKILGQFGMGVREHPIRTYKPEEAIQSQTIPMQVKGFAGLSDPAKTEFVNKAREMGILSAPGYADEAGNTQRGLGFDVLKFAKPWRGGGENDGGRPNMYDRGGTLEDELAKVNSSAGYKDKYRTKIQELASLAADLQARQQYEKFAKPPAPIGAVTPPAVQPQIPAPTVATPPANWVTSLPNQGPGMMGQNAQPMPRPTPISGLPNQSAITPEMQALIDNAIKQGLVPYNAATPLQVTGPRPAVPPGINLRSSTRSPGISSSGQRISYGR